MFIPAWIFITTVVFSSSMTDSVK